MKNFSKTVFLIRTSRIPPMRAVVEKIANSQEEAFKIMEDFLKKGCKDIFCKKLSDKEIEKLEKISQN